MSNYRPGDYRPSVDPELNGWAVRAGLSTTELLVFIWLRTCIESREAGHGLFKISSSTLSWSTGIPRQEMEPILDRLGKVQINGQPVIVFDADVVFIPTMAAERRFPEGYTQRSVLRAINKALKDFQTAPSEFVDEEGKRCLVNRAFLAFQSAHLELISEVVIENAAEAARKRNKDNDRPPQNRQIHPEDLPDHDDRHQPPSGLDDELFRAAEHRVLFSVSSNSARNRTETGGVPHEIERNTGIPHKIERKVVVPHEIERKTAFPLKNVQNRSFLPLFPACTRFLFFVISLFFRFEARKEGVRGKIFSPWREAVFRHRAFGFG